MPSSNIEVPDSAWFKSSHSGGNETECVEVAFTAAGAAVRDSKWPCNHQLVVQPEAWTGFICAARRGELG
ncbi:DUF397 domain-containing protein [Streptomyces sp. NBC_00439]|uniref:DUF397 domain-containing protein n=1 Tax=Streptomyces TaxID=1883 RepID=UPI002252C8D2|nr:DUF397 domain-containing protein [Streptomyces sp. NBC_00439]MCX5100946.1 DUF397 domain-containing protein [Streptomyces sp. NBC_00439]